MGKKKKPGRRTTYIRAWRKARNKTQPWLAEAIGISVPQLSRIETGEQEYRQDLLELIAEALGVGPADLLMRDPSQPEGLWSIWDQLRPAEQQQAVAVMRAIKGTGTDG